MSEALDYLKPEYYDNRELSWLKFDYRILSEARDKTNPLFERLKFLSITASNLGCVLKGYGSCGLRKRRHSGNDAQKAASCHQRGYPCVSKPSVFNL